MPPTGAGLRVLAPRHLGLLVPLSLVGAVLALIAPVPAWLIDVLLTANITAAIIILLQTIQVRRPLDFSVFPALLLATTLVRLVLNVASTRLILTDAPLNGVAAAGGVIAAFGEFVAAGSPLVGGVVFAILVVIQFVVITKGATRISEVAARFALDGMPGRQSAVDADLNSGLITPEQARQRRDEIARQADFYGAMDGASKFVRGDAIAGVLITLVNILGGLAIGVLQEGMPLSEAVSIYTTLTIGDGLVSQVPAFLISLAAGLIVTRSSADSDLSRDVIGQMLGSPLPLLVGAGFLSVLAFSGFPMLPMLGLAGACAAIGLMLTYSPGVSPDSSEADLPAMSSHATNAPPATSPAASSPLERHLLVEPLELDLGVSLVRLADRTAGGDLLERVSHLRDRIAGDLGFILPKVRIQDDLRLDPRQFRIKLRGAPAASGTVYADAVLAVDDGFVAGELTGIEGIEPATGHRGVWIDRGQSEQAKHLGFRIVPPQSVILQVLEHAVRRNAGELLTREHVHGLLNHLRDRAPRLVDELVPARLSGSDVHRVLANLLSEGVPIRDLETILEALGDAASCTRQIDELTAAVRFALRRTIVQQYRDDRGLIHVVLLDEDSHADMRGELQRVAAMHTDRARLLRSMPWLSRLTEALERLSESRHPPVVLCRGEIRAAVHELMVQTGTFATVLGHRELPPDVQVRVHTEISTSRESHTPCNPEDAFSAPVTQATSLSNLQLAAA